MQKDFKEIVDECEKACSKEPYNSYVEVKNFKCWCSTENEPVCPSAPEILKETLDSTISLKVNINLNF